MSKARSNWDYPNKFYTLIVNKKKNPLLTLIAYITLPWLKDYTNKTGRGGKEGDRRSVRNGLSNLTLR